MGPCEEKALFVAESPGGSGSIRMDLPLPIITDHQWAICHGGLNRYSPSLAILNL